MQQGQALALSRVPQPNQAWLACLSRHNELAVSRACKGTDVARTAQQVPLSTRTACTAPSISCNVLDDYEDLDHKVCMSLKMHHVCCSYKESSEMCHMNVNACHTHCLDSEVHSSVTCTKQTWRHKP